MIASRHGIIDVIVSNPLWWEGNGVRSGGRGCGEFVSNPLCWKGNEFDMSSIEDERLRKRVEEKMRKKFGKIDKPEKKEEASEPTAATFSKVGEPAGKPVSEAFVLKSKNEEISQAVKEAMAAVDSVHGDGVLAPDTPIFGKQLPIGLQGETV